MKKFFAKPFCWAIVFSVLLASFTTFIFLDTFLLKKEYSDVEPIDEEVDDGLKEEMSEPVVTDDSYSDGNIEIKIISDRYNDTDVYSADIKIKNPKLLKTAFAKNEKGEPKFGLHINQLISEIATDNGAIVAINGDFYGYRDRGFVLRNGVLYRSISCSEEALVINGDGSFSYVLEDETDAEVLEENGAWQVFSFGPVLVRNGEMSIDRNRKINKEWNEWASNPRTAIGMVEPGHYIFTVSDGRTPAAKGLSLYQLGEYMMGLGCTEVYNLDGGGTSELWFNGRVINHPTGDGKTIGEREMSDIVYIGYVQ